MTNEDKFKLTQEEREDSCRVLDMRINFPYLSDPWEDE